MMKLELVTTIMLATTTVFSYVHESYGSAVIGAACTGLVAGMTFTKWIVQRRDRES
jgi:hypothetical protein